jgi:Ca2+-binding RTX toxin-like protein
VISVNEIVDRGADIVYGGPGDDEIDLCCNAPATVDGWEDDDRIEGGEGDDVLLGSEEGDVVDGGPGNDRLPCVNDGEDGGDGNDVLEGGRNSDNLYGGPGDDTLRGDGCRETGKPGRRDVCDGGRGTDVQIKRECEYVREIP